MQSRNPKLFYAINHSSTKRSLEMKMHVLTVAVLTALASRAVLAASEGGDTWSAVEAIQESSSTAAQLAQRVDPANPVLDDAFKGSEGGDTWSSLQAVRETTVQQAGIQQRPDRTGTQYAGQAAGSEGGDTWSRFVPQFQGQPTGSANLASAPKGGKDYWQPPFGE
jgi:hypothetical protein